MTTQIGDETLIISQELHQPDAGVGQSLRGPPRGCPDSGTHWSGVTAETWSEGNKFGKSTSPGVCRTSSPGSG